jgi:hypothetical protein
MHHHILTVSPTSYSLTRKHVQCYELAAENEYMRSDIPLHEPSCDRTQESKHKQTPQCIIGSFGDKDECTGYRNP